MWIIFEIVLQKVAVFFLEEKNVAQVFPTKVAKKALSV